MKGEDHVGAIADAQAAGHVAAGGLQGGHLSSQGFQIHDDAVADDGSHAFPQDAAGDQLEDEFLGSDKDGMAGIVAALIPRDDIEMFGKKIDYFPFSFVAPLRAEDNYVTHNSGVRSSELL